MKQNDTLLRHWRMLREIPRYPRRISTVELKQRLGNAGFDTTIRTIQRDLIKLSGALPLLSDDSKPQGWSWEADAAQLDLPTLEPQAALVFYFAEKYLKSLLPGSTLNHLSPWFRTAAGVLDKLGNGLSSWRKKVRVLAPGQPLRAAVIDHDVQSAVTEALLMNRRLEVTYRPRNGTDAKVYEASPLGLVVRDQVIYLVCTLREYGDIKQLVLSRIQHAVVQESPARNLESFDLDDYIAQGAFGIQIGGGRAIHLVAEFDRQVAVSFTERPLDPMQIVEDIDENTVRLTATVSDTLELRRWLMGFDVCAEVIEPIFLRDDIRSMIDRMQKRYSRK